jgi:cytidylate kinase
VSIYALPEVRIQRLRERLNISELDARRRITSSDEQKRMYIRNAHKNANWKDPKYYHLMINTGYITPETAAELIIQAAKSRANE